MLAMAKVLPMVRGVPKRLGVFDTVDGHEPLNAPGRGLHCFSYAGPVRTVAAASSITSAAILVNFTVRIQTLAIAAKGQSNNDIDKNLLRATGVLFDAYIGHFRLTDHAGSKLVRCVDVFGAYGSQGLTMVPGYLNSDGTIFRVGVINLPLLLNDEYDEEE
jgi:hypothetical protein